jgi:hypothetical protein
MYLIERMHMIGTKDGALPDSVKQFFGGEGESKSSTQAESESQVFTSSMEIIVKALAQRILEEYREGGNHKALIDLLQRFAEAIGSAAAGGENISPDLLEVAMKGFVALATPGAGDKVAAQAMVAALNKRYGDLSE